MNPSASASPHGSRSPVRGMFPYGASPSRMRSAPTTPASPTSITPRGVSTLRPMRNPSRNTATAANAHVGQTKPGAPLTPAQADPQAAPEQVREHRIRERHAREDLPEVEEDERDGEREQDDQVEVPHRERAAHVCQPDEKEDAEAEPHVPGLERLAAERPVPPARHLPGDLRSRPRLRDPPGAVFDHHLRDLARVPRPGLHEPGPVLGAEARGRGRIGRVAVEPRGDLRVLERALDRLVLGQPRRLTQSSRGEEQRKERDR